VLSLSPLVTNTFGRSLIINQTLTNGFLLYNRSTYLSEYPSQSVLLPAAERQRAVMVEFRYLLTAEFLKNTEYGVLVHRHPLSISLSGGGITAFNCGGMIPAGPFPFAFSFLNFVCSLAAMRWLFPSY
jgi:hypothetical protein